MYSKAKYLQLTFSSNETDFKENTIADMVLVITDNSAG